MAGAVHFFATTVDEDLLLDHLLNGSETRLFSWWDQADLGDVYRQRARSLDRVGVWAPEIGDLHWMSSTNPTSSTASRSRLFDRINWSRNPHRKLLDVNQSSALLWERGSTELGTLTPSSIGHQADSLAAMPDEFRRWFSRVTS